MIDKYKHNRTSIMDFFQTLRVSQLTEQFLHWSSPESIDNLYRDLHRRVNHLGIKDDFVLQRWADGYLTFEAGTLKYEEMTTGKTFVLRKNFKDQDHVCYKELHDAGKASGKFRSNELVFREVVTIGSDQYEYLEFVSPNGEYGENFMSSYFSSSLGDMRAVSEEFIKQLKDIAVIAKSVSDRHHTGFPNLITVIWDRWKDKNGYFWSEILDWNGSYQDFVSNFMVMFQHGTEMQKAEGKLSEADAKELINFARVTWQQI